MSKLSQNEDIILANLGVLSNLKSLELSKYIFAPQMFALPLVCVDHSTLLCSTTPNAIVKDQFEKLLPSEIGMLTSLTDLDLCKSMMYAVW